ncbi:MAG: sulfite exporter TauE/SafE family protein [Pseudomonadota bacterium]
MLPLLLLYAALGAVAGLLAGLFGVGGGIVIVPILVLAFDTQGVPAEVAMHAAVATSLATIVFTSCSSALSHQRRGAVRWGVVARLAPGIVAGTFAGASVARWVPGTVLKAVFVVFLAAVSVRMLRGSRPREGSACPGTAGMLAAGGGIGAVSSWVGIGGGTLTVPFLSWCAVPIHEAVGSSSAVGLFIAVSGSLGYALGGLGVQGVPAPALGYISLPALAGIAGVSVLTAPLGARLAHRLDTRRLEQGFAILLLLVAARMACKLL